MVEANAGPAMFKADKTILLIVSNGDYSGTRTNDDLTSYSDITGAKTDSDTARKFLGHHDDQHQIILENTSQEDIKAQIQSVSAKVILNRDSGLKTLLKVYYTGHGAMTTTTQCATCSSKSKRQYYPLEKMLKEISKYELTYVFGIFDCCRNEIKDKKQAKKKGLDNDSEDSDDDTATRETNCVFLYRCRPSDKAFDTSAMSSALC